MTAYEWPLQKNTLSFLDRLKLATFVLTSDKFTQGEKVEQFENEWNDWLGSKHSLFVSSGSTANFLLIAAVRELYLKHVEKPKVLLPACTWVTNINPILQLGMEPVFCDINLYNYSFNIDNMNRIRKVHPDIHIVFATHLLGIPAHTQQYKALFPNAIHLDDVCESHGCENYNKKVGSDSTGATFSFYFGHHMSTIEGGMISTNDEELYNLMKMKRSHGLARTSSRFADYAERYPTIDKQFLFMTDGYNFRNTELAAVLGISQLKRLDKFIENRRQRYIDFALMMSTMEEYFHPIIPYNYIIDHRNSSFCFPFVAHNKETKKRLIEIFNQNKIEYRPIVGGNLLRQPYLGHYSIECPSNYLCVDILHENGVYIGNNQFVTADDMKWLASILGEFSYVGRNSRTDTTQ